MSNFQSKKKLVELLLKCKSISNRQTRGRIVAELSYFDHIEHHDVDRIHVFNIVESSLDYPDGLGKLLDILQFFEGNAIPMQKLKQYVDLTYPSTITKNDFNNSKQIDIASLAVQERIRKAKCLALINELVSIIQRSLLNEEKLKSIYRYCLPEQLRSKCQFSQSEHQIVESLIILFDINLKESEHAFSACLFAKIVESMSRTSLKVDEWIDLAISEMNQDFRRSTVESEASEICSKLDAEIKAQEENKDNADNYHVQEIVIRVTENDPNGYDNILVDIFEVREVKHLGKKEEYLNKLESIKTNVQSLSGEIRQKLKNHLRYLAWIELLLPLELMDINFEFVESKVESLIGRHIVIRRFKDRHKNISATKKTEATNQEIFQIRLWSEIRSKLFRGQGYPVRDFHHSITRSCLDDFNQLCWDLDSNQKICCTISEDHPHSDFKRLTKQHLASGIPIMIWPGKEYRLQAQDQDVIELLNQSAERLPREVNKLRKKRLGASQKRYAENNLFFIYDDPRRMRVAAEADEDLSFLEEAND